jgi:DNA-binding CsgD family transcriptional regulator
MENTVEATWSARSMSEATRWRNASRCRDRRRRLADVSHRGVRPGQIDGRPVPRMRRPSDRPSLTAREREVLAWISLGKSAWEIGEILGIAKRTVDEHAQTAARKLGAANRTQAVAIAVRDGLIDL